ncbi:MAG: hypothetical protein ABI835_22235 [Chloroflexota bacterium]
MNEEFHRRQTETNQNQQQAAQQKHATLETYNLEQQEAHSGHHTPGASGDRNPVTTPPTLWQRIKKILGMG